MALPKIAINGFGRFGRTIVRIAKLRKHYDMVAANDLASPDQLAYAFKYDSTHGVFPGEVSFDGDRFKVLSERGPTKLPWEELGVDYVIESSGAKRVVLTVPCKDSLDATLVSGVNDHVVTPSSTIISNASCPTNCAAPLTKVLHDSFGIRRGLLTTVHAYTSGQRLIDFPMLATSDVRVTQLPI